LKTKERGGKKPWGGRFKEEMAGLVERFTASVHFDSRLLPYDVAVGIAHVRMLARQGIITAGEADKLEAGLDRVLKDVEAGQAELLPELEDVHMNVERLLAQRVGEVGWKLHTGRSRNDLVATDLRLYLRDAIAGLRQRVRDLQAAVVSLARKNLSVIMPGYTHMQRAQPVLFSHHMMAYYEMLRRDEGRLQDCAWRMDEMPLGSAALAGPGFPTDRQFLAGELGFGGLSRNSIDAVSDRDFALELAAACSIIMVHLSRMSEELVLWSTQEFGFVELPDSFCTGSSIMPQKKNPDVPELVRGKSGRVIGSLSALLVMMKGLPLAYNRDLQEDKEQLFEALDTTRDCLEVMAALLPGVKVRSERMSAALEAGSLTATDLADYLVMKGVPFRQAHHQVGEAVGYAVREGKDISALTLAEMRRFCPDAGPDVFQRLSPEAAVRHRTAFGGTARKQVQAAIRKAERELVRP